MHRSKFGDSYDIVKKCMLDWLSLCGTWAAHPMFAKSSSQDFADAFSTFLDVPLLTTSPLPGELGREVYFGVVRQWQATDHVFLDPDTGVALPESRVTRAHLKARELLDIALSRPGKLTLVFDQSFPHVPEEDRRILTRAKLIWLSQRGVHGIAYFSHANFLLTSTDPGVLRNARQTLLDKSGLPYDRLVEVRPAKA